MSALPSPLGSIGIPRVLVVDDDAQVRRMLVRHLSRLGCFIEQAGSAEEALDRIASESPDLVLLDVQLPGREGHEVLDTIRSKAELRLVPVVMISGAATREERLRAIRSGASDFISKPFDPEEIVARVGSLLSLKTFTDRLEEAEQVLVALARTIDARDPYTAGHSERVSVYAGALAEAACLTDAEIHSVRQGSLFHDLGKIALRDQVLLKPGPLTPEERLEIQQHPVVGRNLLQHMRTLARALPIVYHHHERLDGSGYPDGISGAAVPVVARVVAIADVYDALTTSRPYRPAFASAEALEILVGEAKRGWWDQDLVDAFRGVVERLPRD